MVHRARSNPEDIQRWLQRRGNALLPSELELHRHVVIGPDPAHLGPSRSERRPTDETHPTNVRTQIERVHVEVLQGW